LGMSYPPALQSLRDRRNIAEVRLSADNEDYSAQADFAAINLALGETAANMAFYDQLPTGSKARSSFGGIVWEQLIDAKRYDDAVEARPYEIYMQTFDINRKMVQENPNDTAMIGFILTSGGKQLEALAGSGRLDQARSLLKALLEVDHSETTRKRFKDHLDRAGHGDLAKE
jgi:hypothetical protein